MKKWLVCLLALTLTLGGNTALADLADFQIAATALNDKVILDTDMGYLADDAVALFGLLQADAAGWIDLLGITTVGGNTLAAPATAATLNQLEAVGRTDVPVYQGADQPLLGFHDLESEARLYGQFQWTGAYEQLSDYTADYKNLGALAHPDWGVPETDAQAEHAVDFMIEQVRAHPGKVTIFAIGALTNVALAIRKDPTFTQTAAGIVYMGGAMDVPGNANATAEFNWWYDAEAASVCLNADWKSQLIVPHDVADKVRVDRRVMDLYRAKNNTPFTGLLVDKVAGGFDEDPDRSDYCWDPITVGVFLCPDLITRREARDVAVETARGYCYGQAVSWPQGMGPKGAATCDVVLDVDDERFWALISDLLGTPLKG